MQGAIGAIERLVSGSYGHEHGDVAERVRATMACWSDGRVTAPMIDLLTRTDPAVIGWGADEPLYSEPEIRAKATHVVELLPYTDRTPRGLLAVLEPPGEITVSFVVLEWVSGPSTDRTMPALYQPLFHGDGPSAGLRELRHTHWGHADDGYLHSPNGSLIAAAFQALKRWFDCWSGS